MKTDIHCCVVCTVHCNIIIQYKKGKPTSLQALTGPEGFQEVEAPSFQDNRHMKVARLSALCTDIPGTYFC
jgi:hypothetical protein